MRKLMFNQLLDRIYQNSPRNPDEYFKEHPEILVSGLSVFGGYLLTRGIQLCIKHTHKDFYINYLPEIEKGLAYILCAAPLAYNIIDPEGVKAIMTQHPLLSQGVASGIVGSATAIFMDANSLDKRKKTRNDLESNLE